MKKLIVGLSVAAMAIGFGASSALATITGSVHDFSGQAWAGGQICVVCHIPHNSGATVGLLWSHADSTQASYTVYGGGTNYLNEIPGQPAGVSKLCLGCHDGTTAVDDYTGTAGSATVNISSFGGGYAVIGAGGDLASTHPISITYNSAFDPGSVNGDPGLKPKATSSFGIDFGTIESVLEGGTTLQCSTCHDVHNSTGEAVGGTALLREDIAGSAICLGCHIK